MTDQSLNIFSLEIAIKLLTGSPTVDSFKPAEISFLSRAHNLFLSYYPKLHGNSDVPGVYEDFNYFVEHKDLNDLRAIADLLSHPEEGEEGETKKAKEPEKETSSIPAELETMVALYKEHQADLLDTDNPHSVAETIKRARKTWSEREKVRLVYENADKERQEKVDEVYRQTVNPKKESRKEINHNTYALAELAIKTQQGSNQLTRKQYNDAIEKLVYAAETGALEIDNTKQLDALSSLVVGDEINIKTVYTEIDQLVQEKQREEELDLESEKVDELNSKINALSSKEDFEYNQSSKEFTNKLSSYYKDYDVIAEQAKKEIDIVIKNLGEAIPNAKLQFQPPDQLSEKGQQLEKLIRSEYPSLLNTSPSGLGARTSATLKETGGKINYKAVDLYSKGLSPDKLREILESDTATAKFLRNNRSLQKQIAYQLKQIKDSPLGKQLDGVYKKVNYLLDPIGSGRTYINKQIGKYAGKQINQVAQKYNSAFGKKLGNYILKYGLGDGMTHFVNAASNAAAKKILITGAKKLGLKTAEMVAAQSAKAALAAALTAASAALGISTAGLSLIIEAAIFIGGQIISFGFTKVRQLFFNDEQWKEIKKDAWKGLLIGGAVVGGSIMMAGRGIKMFGTATKAAVISAVGIIWLSLATIAVFLTLTFLVAPILTTLVQFDSIEKVKYGMLATPTTPVNCSSMAWPFEETHPITQGPRNTPQTNCTHQGGISESVDFSVETGTEILSISDGVVSAVGNDGEDNGYGKYIKIDAKTDKGESFTIVYGHLAEQYVTEGESVKNKQKIGLSDDTGYSSGPHLHLGYVNENGQPIEYNSCPAGGFKVNENCCDTSTCNQP